MKPLFLLPIPGPKGQKMLALIWLAGFGGTLLWQLGSHFRFRRSLLKGARPVERVEIRKLYARARGRCEQKYAIPLLVSHEIQTPRDCRLFPLHGGDGAAKGGLYRGGADPDLPA